MSVKTLLRDAPDDEKIAWAVRQLRIACDETQEQFADRLDATIRTITRYETSRPPRGEALVRLWKIARKKGLEEVADVFRRAFFRDFWTAMSDSGFMEDVYEHVRELFEKHVETELRPKLARKIACDIASNKAAVDLTEDEHTFLAAALAVHRTANPSTQQLLADFEGIFRRARWMIELEEKIHRAEELDADVGRPGAKASEGRGTQ